MFDLFLAEFRKEFNRVAHFIKSDSWRGAELKSEEDNSMFNSYGGLEETDIYKVYYFPEWGIYVKFEGEKNSYGSVFWYDETHEVTPEVETIINYKKV